MPTRPLASSLAIALALGVAGCSAWDAVSQSAVGKGGGVQAVLAPNDRSSGRADVRFVDAPRCYRLPVRLTVKSQGKTWKKEGTLVLHKRGLDRMELGTRTPNTPSEP